MGPWQSALREFALSADSPTSTLFTYAHSFQLPADNVRVWATSLDKDWGGDGEHWQIMGRKLVSDASTVSILYVHLITDVLLFDTLLEKAISADMAARLAYPLTNLTDVQQTFEGIRDRCARQALAINTQEKSKRRFRSDTLTSVR